MPQPASHSEFALTAAYLAQQRLMAATLSRDLVVLVRNMFSTADPGQAWPAVKVAVASLIRERRRQSAEAAARYYIQARQLSQGPTSERVASSELVGGRPGPPIVSEGRTGSDEGMVRTVIQPPRQPARSAGAPIETEPPSVAEAWSELERIADLRPEEIEALSEDRVDANLNATGIASYKKAIRAGQTPERALDTMAVNLSGSATTLMLEGGRRVIHDAVLGDEDAIGWARITDPDPCAFCAMLASRGAVYHSRMTAGGTANKRFVGDGMFKFHNHDACVAKPIFDPDDEALRVADELYDRWLKVTRAAPGMKMIDSWTQYWNGLDPADKPIVQSDQAA